MAPQYHKAAFNYKKRIQKEVLVNLSREIKYISSPQTYICVLSLWWLIQKPEKGYPDRHHFNCFEISLSTQTRDYTERLSHITHFFLVI